MRHSAMLILLAAVAITGEAPPLHWHASADWFPIPYRLLEPPGGGGKRPLILALHGAGQRGSDGSWAFANLAAGVARHGEPCFILAPQCPGDTNTFELARTAPGGGAPWSVAPADGWQPFALPVGTYAAGRKERLVAMAEPGDRKRGSAAFSVRALAIHRAGGGGKQPISLAGRAGSSPGRWGAQEIPVHGSAVTPDGVLEVVVEGRGGGLAVAIDPVELRPGDELRGEVRFATVGASQSLRLDPPTPGEFKGAWQWVRTSWAGKEPHELPPLSRPLAAAIAILDEVVRTRPVDPERIYVVGLSMGGYGTWDLVCRQPERFAAAVPICGGAPRDVAARVGRLPLRIYHGDKDQTVPTVRSRLAAEALRDAGAPAAYIELAGVGHDAWSPAFADAELYAWLFAQRRKR